MSKKRAFVRYSKQGKIVPGSLILTAGSYPNGPSTWKEVPADLCCDGGGGCEPDCTPVPISTTCEGFNFPSAAIGILVRFTLINTCPGFSSTPIDIELGIESPVSSVQDVVDLINSNSDCQENGITAVIDGDCIIVSVSKCKCLYTNFGGNSISSVFIVAVPPA